MCVDDDNGNYYFRDNNKKINAGNKINKSVETYLSGRGMRNFMLAETQVWGIRRNFMLEETRGRGQERNKKKNFRLGKEKNKLTEIYISRTRSLRSGTRTK
jgi:hypothetical protein